jgi:hypothetical protein
LLEFAHNDVTGNLVDFVPAALEGILGQIRAVRPECEFAFVYLALPGTAASGPTPAMEAHERVAHDHGIPSIDLAALSEELVETGQATWRAGERALTVDGVHHAPAAAALLGVPFAEAFLSLLVPPHEAAPPPAPRRGALTRVARVRVADYLRAGVWVVRPPLPAEARGAGIDEEGIAEAREPGAVVRLTIEGTNAFVWTSGNGVLGVRIAEIGAAYRVAVEAAGKWMWCSLMETQPAARYTLEIVALNAGLLLGDIGIVGKLAS